MIKSFRNKLAKEIWDKGYSRKFPETLLRSTVHKLLILDAAVSLQDLAAPNANNLEKLKGVRDTWSIRINEQYRICFIWKQGDAYDVAVEDYHS